MRSQRQGLCRRADSAAAASQSLPPGSLLFSPRPLRRRSRRAQFIGQGQRLLVYVSFHGPRDASAVSVVQPLSSCTCLFRLGRVRGPAPLFVSVSFPPRPCPWSSPSVRVRVFSASAVSVVQPLSSCTCLFRLGGVRGPAPARRSALAQAARATAADGFSK